MAASPGLRVGEPADSDLLQDQTSLWRTKGLSDEDVRDEKVLCNACGLWVSHRAERRALSLVFRSSFELRKSIWSERS